MRGARDVVFCCLALFGALAAGPSSAAVAGTPSAAAPAQEVDWTQVQAYDIVLTEFHFEPARIVLRQGLPYTLRLENQGGFRHTFTAPEFFRTVVFGPHGAATEAEQSGGLSLAADEVKEVTLVPMQAGTYPLDCTKPMHGLFGMEGEIVVE
jgi:uncharacterized cupredoxin-like copper-binding protein